MVRLPPPRAVSFPHSLNPPVQALSRANTDRAAVAPVLGVLLVLATGLRLWGIGFGLPYVLHPDEPLHVENALAFLQGAPDALAFTNPALYRYVLAAVFEVIRAVAHVGDEDVSTFHLAARATSAGLGALTVLGTYLAAAWLRGERAGLIAAGLTAVTYLLVREAHFAVNDALAAMLASFALASTVRVARRGHRADYVWAGVTLGLAFAAKYQTAVVLVPLLIAHAQHGRRRQELNLLVALAAAAVAAVLAFPPLLTETRRVLGDVWVGVVLPSRLGYEGLDASPGAGYVYYMKVLGWGVGWPMLAVACFGVFRGIARKDWPLLVVASGPVLMYALAGASHLYFARFLLPAIPGLIVVCAVVIADLARPAPILAAMLAVATLAGTLPESVRFDLLLTRPDTRLEARQWIETHLPPGARIVAEREAEGPPLDNVAQEVIHPAGHPIFDVTPNEYRANGVGYIVTSSYTADAPTIDPARDARRRAFYSALREQAQLLVELRPYRRSPPAFVYDRLYGPFDSLDEFEQPGPTIRVFQL